MSDSLQEALRHVKYNEAAIINIPLDGGDVKEVILVATVDEDGNGISWQDASSRASNVLDCKDHRLADVGILCHLKTKKWVFPMLNDAYRNQLYESSIQKACEALVQKLKDSSSDSPKVINVLDIGTGTGLLAMLAAKSLEKAVETSKSDVGDISVKVTSMEMASAMARLARRTIESNKMSNTITVIEKHSCDPNFSMSEASLITNELDGNLKKTNSIDDTKATLCVSELLESGLLGEGIIPSIRDAWDRHLCDDAIIIPQRARVYAQVVEGSHSVALFRGPTVYPDGIRLCTEEPGSKSVLCGGNGINGGFLVPIHADALIEGENDVSEYILGRGPSDTESVERVKPLTDATLVLDFDFTSKESIPPKGRRLKQQNLITPIMAGLAHGVLFWWELDLWEGLTYSTEAGKSPWQDHWQQCLYVFGENQTELKSIELNVPFYLNTYHDDTGIAFEIEDIPMKKSNNDDRLTNKRQRLSSTDEAQTVTIEGIIDDHEIATKHQITPERALQLNDRRRMTTLHDAIAYALKVKGLGATILDVGDFSLCALIAAASCGALVVNSLESSSGDIPMMSAMVCQLGNGLPRRIPANHETGSTEEVASFQILQSHLDSLTTEHLLGGRVDIVMAEPYFEVLEGWHLQESLNYHYMIKSMKKRGLLKNDSLSVPSYAVVVACAVEFSHLNKAHGGLTSKRVCGFLHEEAEYYGNRYHERASSFPMWQYGWKQLSHQFDIATIQYDGEVEHMTIADGEWVESYFIQPGTCHGLVYWVDYHCRVKSSENEFVPITTGNMHHRQAVQMLKTPFEVTNPNKAKILVKPKFKDSGLETHTFELKVEGST